MNFDLIIRTLLDKASSKQLEEGLKSTVSSLDAVDKKSEGISKNVSEWSKSLLEAERLSKKFGDEFTKRYEAAIKTGKSLEEAIAGVREELEKVNKPGGKGGIDDQIKRANAEASLLRKQVAEMGSDLEQTRIASLRTVSGFIGGIGQRALLGGTAVAGGIFLAAKNYIKDAEQSDRLTRRWLAATQEIEKSQDRIGRVAAQAVLPFLEKAADVAEDVASFTESHPEIVQAALNIGLMVAGFGALASAVSKGIKLVADIKYLATIPVQLEAARLQDQAAEKQLLAAQQRLDKLGVPTPDGKTPAGGGLGLLNTIGLIVAGIVASGAVVTVVDQVLEGSGFGRQRRDAINRARDQGARIYPGILPPNERNLQSQLNRAQIQGDTQEIARLRGELDKLGEQSKSTADDLAQAVTGLRGSAHEAEIVSAFEQWKEDDARIVQEAAARRVEIIKDAERQVVAATAQFANQVAAINANADRRAEQITSSFLQANAQEEADYQENRAQIIRDGGQEIREIEEAHQERLRKMEQDHNERAEGLTASRDALGLAKEQRRFNQERAEENRATRMEIAKRRADLAERLADLARQHEAERAQRLAQYQEALAENEAQRKEELEQAAAAFAEQQNQIREQRAQQLRELQEGLNAERIRRREVFIQQIRDLDAALLGERELRARHYSEMLQQAEAFFSAWRALMPSATALPPAHDYTGYAYTGIYRMAANGQPEYVLGGAATKAAEQIIGRGLTQDAILTTLARGSRNSRSLTINDHSRFDGRISAAQVRAIKQETIGEIARELG